jgi:molecular chaperone GrpE
VTDKGRKAGSAGASAEPAPEHVVIKDKRKIDPSGRPKAAAAGDGASSGTPEAGAADDVTEAQAAGATVDAAQTSGAAPPDIEEEFFEGESVEAAPRSMGAELEALRAERDEHMADLQRISAEYANYRKRVERDRTLMAEQAVGNVLSTLLPILDDLDRAREHGDLVGPFGGVAEQLNAALGKFGLIGFGEAGDPFDPTRHEAVAHQTSADVTEPTCVAVMRRGYLLGERLLRPALVAVADPE